MADLIVSVVELGPHLSDAAHAAFVPEGYGAQEPLEDMIVLGKRYASEPTPEDLRRLGLDLSALVEDLASMPEKFPDLLRGLFGKFRAFLGPVCVPLMIPLCKKIEVGKLVSVPLYDWTPDGFAVMLHARVAGADEPDVRAHVAARAAERGLRVVAPGELP